MNNTKTYIKQVIDGFQNNRGKASVYCFNTAIIPELVYNIIIPYFNKRPHEQLFIVVDGYNTRCKIINYFKIKGITEDNGYNIKILSQDYIKLKYCYKYNFTILIGINDDINIIKKLSEESIFTLCVLTKNIMNNDFINNVRDILKDIVTADSDIAIRQDLIYSPVEEHRCKVELLNEDKELYEKYSDYINSTVSIIGSLDNIEKCKYGDIKNNISASEFRTNLAKENGWSENLDVTIPFIRQIDDNFNPNIIYEKVCNFYNIAKKRRELVESNKAKLEIIKNICIENKDKRILIVSKSGEFAHDITNYINQNTSIKCGDYHDSIPDAHMYDSHGEKILIKSGVDKGKPKIFKSRAQSSAFEALFNNDLINVLSIKFSSNTALKITCDVVIITTPLYEDIVSIKTRFANVAFDSILTKTYKIYCDATIESNTIQKEKPNPIIKIINEYTDENNVDIIL